MRAVDRDIWATAGAALVCAAAAVSVPVTAVRAVFAVPLCLVLPGYAITQAAFTWRRSPGLQTLMLVPALSLATLAVGSLLLDAAPGGLRLGSWATFLIAVVLSGCGVAVARRGLGTFEPRPRTFRRIRPADALLVGVAASAAIAALVVSRIPLPARNAVGYTQLSMLSSGTPSSPAVRIDVRSGEQHVTTYRLLLASGSGSPTVVDSRLTLRPGGGTEITVPLVPLSSGAPALVIAQLYRLGGSAPYRRVTALIQPPPVGRTTSH